MGTRVLGLGKVMEQREELADLAIAVVGCAEATGGRDGELRPELLARSREFRVLALCLALLARRTDGEFRRLEQRYGPLVVERLRQRHRVASDIWGRYQPLVQRIERLVAAAHGALLADALPEAEAALASGACERLVDEYWEIGWDLLEVPKEVRGDRRLPLSVWWCPHGTCDRCGASHAGNRYVRPPAGPALAATGPWLAPDAAQLGPRASPDERRRARHFWLTVSRERWTILPLVGLPVAGPSLASRIATVGLHLCPACADAVAPEPPGLRV